MLERIDALEQRMRELQAKVTELVDSVREMMEARAVAMLERSEGDAGASPPDAARRK